jgi:carbamoyl-phosphate synthase large subunit
MPKASSPKYVSSLNKVIQRDHVQAVFPQPDTELGKISAERDSIQARLFLPDQATVSACLDKYSAIDKWHTANLRSIPVILSIKDPMINEKIQKLNYPCWLRAREGAGGLLSCLAKQPTTVNHWLSFHWGQGLMTDFIAEEYLSGRDFCFMSIWSRGQLVTSMTRERLSWVGHRLVGTGGTSRLNRVVHSDQVNRTAVKAIKSITDKPHGIFCVDLKDDSEEMSHPTEINCRFTTNVHYLTLAAIRTGHQEWNFPWIAALLAMEEKIPACEKYDALPEGLWFTKNIDMGFTMVTGNRWNALEIG